MSRLVMRWDTRAGRLVRVGAPPRQTATVVRESATRTGQFVLNPKVFTGGTEVPPVAWGEYTDYPTIQWHELDTQYSLRNLNRWAELPDVDYYLNRLTSRAYVQAPDGFRGKHIDFKSRGTAYGIYAPNCMGMFCLGGPQRAVIRIEPYSSTKASLVPLQPPPNTVANNDGGSNPYTMVRFGPMNSSTSAAVHTYGIAFMGTNQPDQPANPQRTDQPAHPHNYSGFQDYMGSGSSTVWCVFGGVQGDWQSPPGETFQFAMLRSKSQCFMDHCEVTGFNEGAVASGAAPTDYVGATGERVGGGVGSNAAVNPTYRWNYIHDAFVSSGPIVSGAGGPAGTLCQGGTIIGNRIHRNANHFPTSTGGKQFGAFNDEGCVPGPNNIPLRVEDNEFYFTANQKTLNQKHAFFGNWAPNPNHPDIRMLRNKWQGPQFNSPAGTWIPGTVGPYGAPLYYSMVRNYSGQPNTQTTYPVVTHPDTGVVMTPVIRNTATGQGLPSNVDARTQYILEL